MRCCFCCANIFKKCFLGIKNCFYSPIYVYPKKLKEWVDSKFFNVGRALGFQGKQFNIKY